MWPRLRMGLIFKYVQCSLNISPVQLPSLAIYGVYFHLEPPTLNSAIPAIKWKFCTYFIALTMIWRWQTVQTNGKKKHPCLSSLIRFCWQCSMGKGAHKRWKNSCAKNWSQREEGLINKIEYCQGYFQSDTTCLEKWLYTNCVWLYKYMWYRCYSIVSAGSQVK